MPDFAFVNTSARRRFRWLIDEFGYSLKVDPTIPQRRGSVDDRYVSPKTLLHVSIGNDSGGGGFGVKLAPAGYGFYRMDSLQSCLARHGLKPDIRPFPLMTAASSPAWESRVDEAIASASTSLRQLAPWELIGNWSAYWPPAIED
jgi:hypothetical protein